MQDVVVGTGITATEVQTPSGDRRLRLTAALTRASTEWGYLAVAVDRIARYAGLTVDDFHEHFASKDECLLAAFERFLERLFSHVNDECRSAGDWPEKVKTVIEAGFEYVAELEGTARLFVVDAKSAGPAAIELTAASIGRAATRLKHGRLLYPMSAGMPDPTEGTLVAGVVMIASVHLLAEEAYMLPELAPEAVEMVLTPYIGRHEARRLAAA
jgi:AcrR family transcriptional regulator